jgi:Polyketide cyclase / dehydrase and lipid transport
MSGLAAKALGGGGGSGKKGGGREKTRRLPIQRWTDVAAPISTVYNKWTEFEEFPKFMHRVLNVKQEEDDKIQWQEKIWFSTRQWEGEITERRKNERIAWKTTSGTSHEGVITFHKLDDKLTRVMVDLDFHPSGMIEKMASGMRFVKRAVEADLARFKAYVELGEAEGLEYNHETEAGGGKDKDAKDDEESNGNGQKSRSQSNGNRSRSQSDDDDDQENAREERAERRAERRS